MVYYRMVWGESMKVEAIRVWGDSILKGIVFDSARKRYTIIKDNALSLLSEKVVTPIQNFSRMGATAPEALKALKAKLADASLENQIVVFEVGGNDCDFDWKAVADTPEAEHQPKTPVAVFADVLHEFVSVVSRAGGTPVLCTLPPIDCARYFAWITRDGLNKEHILRFLGVQERIYRWQEYYYTVALRVAAQTNSLCLPLREAFLERVRGEDVLCEDGIHPNALGHRIIAETAMRGMVKCGFAPCT